MLSQDALVGVKCMWNRLCRPSQPAHVRFQLRALLFCQWDCWHYTHGSGSSIVGMGPDQYCYYSWRTTLDAIIAALDGGMSKAAVCRNFGVKPTTLIETLARVGWTDSCRTSSR